MATRLLPEEEVEQIAEEVRERFLKTHSENDEFDPRDLQRIRSDLEYVAKFTRQQRGNHDNTINQLVEALKWRKSFGINVGELVFTGPRDKELPCTLSLTNTSQDAPAIFKIKTTAPRRYKVRPNLALVQPKAVAKVQVLLVPGSPDIPISDDKFLIQVFPFPVSASVPSPDQLASFWKSLSEKDVTEHRMRCRWVKDEAVSLLPSPTITSTPLPQTPPTLTNVKEAQLQQRDLRSINDKLEKLLKANQALSRRVHRLNILTILLLALLLALLLKTLVFA